MWSKNGAKRPREQDATRTQAVSLTIQPKPTPPERDVIAGHRASGPTLARTSQHSQMRSATRGAKWRNPGEQSGGTPESAREQHKTLTMQGIVRVPERPVG